MSEKNWYSFGDSSIKKWTAIFALIVAVGGVSHVLFGWGTFTLNFFSNNARVPTLEERVNKLEADTVKRYWRMKRTDVMLQKHDSLLNLEYEVVRKK